MAASEAYFCGVFEPEGEPFALVVPLGRVAAFGVLEDPWALALGCKF